MRLFVARELRGIRALELESLEPAKAIASGQIRIAMRAASVNYRDLLALSGRLGQAGPGGLVPCSDGAGEVVAIAPDVTRFKVGDRVALTFNPEWIGGPFKPTPGARGRGSPNLAGVMQDELVVHQSEAVLLPPHLTFVEGACYPCAGVTAWHALCGTAPLYPGMTVLLQGSGGVSVFALQFSKLFGARVIMTTSSSERCDRLTQLGADHTINYRGEPNWEKRVRELTDGFGADLTIDVGGAETVDRSLAATRLGGRVALVGLLSGSPNATTGLFTSGADVSSIKAGSRDDFEAMNRAIAFHECRPVIADEYAFAQLPEALEQLESGAHMGKIAIDFTR